VGDQLLITASFYKETGKSAGMRAGLYYAFHSQFFMKALIATVPGEGLLCVGFRLKQYTLQLSAMHHAQLGITPGLMLNYDLINKTKEE
jgi:hypothetical protein